LAGVPAEPSHLAVGHLARAHGTKGEVFVWPLTDQPDAVFAPGRTLWVGDAEGQRLEPEQTVEVFAVRPFKRGLLVSFRGLLDRTAVEPLSGQYLMAPRTTLAPPEADELWYHQLLGMRVETMDGEVVGTVREVYEAAPADLIEVEARDGGRILVPATKRIVRRFDPAERVLVIDPPEGLLEL
jgi:16S rRNA processing protein RimM